MKEIVDRDDVSKLVNTFYDKIRKDEVLGSIFEMHLANGRWPAHLEKLTDFWETNLFGIPKFGGNPQRAHAVVDRNLDYGVSQDHFSHWVEMWHQTINEMFEGRLANIAKMKAERMAQGLFLGVVSNRPENNILSE